MLPQSNLSTSNFFVYPAAHGSQRNISSSLDITNSSGHVGTNDGDKPSCDQEPGVGLLQIFNIIHLFHWLHHKTRNNHWRQSSWSSSIASVTGNITCDEGIVNVTHRSSSSHFEDWTFFLRCPPRQDVLWCGWRISAILECRVRVLTFPSSLSSVLKT